MLTEDTETRREINGFSDRRRKQKREQEDISHWK
jgi:hypothetical protein